MYSKVIQSNTSNSSLITLYKSLSPFVTMSYPYPHNLTGLTEREAITDVLYRVIIGFDSNDFSFIESAFAGEDAVVDFNGKTIPGLSAVKNAIFATVGPLDTTHNLSNIRVDVKDGANTASLTAVAIAQHAPTGTGPNPAGKKFLAGSQYWIDLVKEEGSREWKIKKFTTKIMWTQGDPSVMGH